jgi:hypothetical protein
VDAVVAAAWLERPLHIATDGANHTVCGMPAAQLREYPLMFSPQDVSPRCPMCDETTA